MTGYEQKYEDIALKKWAAKYSIYDEKRACYDGWFDKFLNYIEECNDPIIDLGCGNGNNAYKIYSMGKKVIACDYNENALKLINEHGPNIITNCFDMREGLPFNDNYTSLVIADLSLHYFNEKDTINIINEIRRILKPNGTLMIRVNSLSDTNYGSEMGEEVEKHFRVSDLYGYKRFFDKEDIMNYFKDFEILYINEEPMDERYELHKILWKVVLKNNK